MKDMTEHISHRAAVINSLKIKHVTGKLQEIRTRETHSTSGANINSTKLSNIL